MRTTDVTFNRFLAELHAVGGEVRYVRQRNPGAKEYLWSPPSAEFGVTKDGRPVIDIDLNQAELLAGVAHEMTHFRDWLVFYREFKTRGLGDVEASLKAKDRMIDDVDFQRDSEVRAVETELDIEARHQGNPFMSGIENRPTKFWQTANGLSYISRVLYPDVVAFGRVLNKVRSEHPWELTPERFETIANQARVRGEKYLTNIIVASAENRSKSVDYLLGVHDKYASHPDSKVRSRAEEALAEAGRLARIPLFDLVFRPEERSFFASAGNLDLLVSAYQAQTARLVEQGRVVTDQIRRPRLGNVNDQLSEQQQQQQQQ